MSTSLEAGIQYGGFRKRPSFDVGANVRNNSLEDALPYSDERTRTGGPATLSIYTEPPPIPLQRAFLAVHSRLNRSFPSL